MTRTAAPSAAPRPAAARDAGARPADVLVVFGITGDLAKVMTFRSLYRLEQRGLLDCPIVGVAVDDWTVDQPEGTRPRVDRGNRREARSEVFDGSPSACPTSKAISATVRPTSGWRTRSAAPKPGVLSGDPAVPVRHGRQGPGRGGADEGRPRRRREAVRPRPRLCVRAGRGAPRVHRRVPALPHRPLPREDGPRGDHAPPLPELDAGADLEPQLRRVGADHHGRELRRRGPRPFLRSGRRAPRRGREPPHAGGRRSRDGGSVSRRPGTVKDAQVGLFHAVEEADPAHYVRGQYDGYLDIDGVAADSTTETYAALRLEIENWRWSGVPFFIRTGKRLPATQTELRLVFKQPPRLGFGRRAAAPSRTSSW